MNTEQDNPQQADGNEKIENQDLPNQEKMDQKEIAEESELAVSPEGGSGDPGKEIDSGKLNTENPEMEQGEEEQTNDSESNETKSEEEEIPFKNYKELDEEVLIGEAERLLKNHPVHKIRKHFYEIKNAINASFQKDEELKKQAFVDGGGNEIDFYYDNPRKQKFFKVYGDFKKQLDAYHKNQEKQEDESLKLRLQLIEQLKAMYLEPTQNNAEIFKAFRELRTKWNNAGRIPRAYSRDVFRTYYHHLDNFYEYLNLNKELREMDWQHNLEVRKTIIKRAEQLVDEPNIQKVLNELQYLHKLWKEEAVPVADEHREPTWERFKELTSKIHERKEEYQSQIQQEQEENLKKKRELIAQIDSMIQVQSDDFSHSEWQKRIKQFEKIRQDFLNTGRVPREFNNQTWDEFKTKSREFNRKKNQFYKSLKKNHATNLEKKLELIEIAKKHQDSTDWETSVQEVKRIQREWKTIGHVPRSQSDKVWNEFKEACNSFFDRYKNRNNQRDEGFHENLLKKEELLKELNQIKLDSSDKEKALKIVNDFNLRWNSIGKVPRSKMKIQNDFDDKIDELLGALDLNAEEIQELKLEAQIQQIIESQDEKLLNNQIYRIRRTLDELEKEYQQLQTNINFFSNADENNPLVSDVYRQIREKKEKITESEILLRKLSSIDFMKPEEDEVPEEESEQPGEE